MGAVGEYIIIGFLLLFALAYLVRRMRRTVRSVKKNDVCKHCPYAGDGCGKDPADCR
ncbi:MAG: FeoB-associated Cys-rich membrane protein [Deltaproteobacteria bacterium]|nr:FeoB-associated Cys-rich membrane protein [Candidatus Zymogenaceae bacterium]